MVIPMSDPAVSSAGPDRTHLPVHVRKARAGDLNVLKAVIARAFDDDPFVNWLVVQDARRARRIFDLMALELDMQMQKGEVYTSGDVQGAAIWSPPGKASISFVAQLRSVRPLASSTSWKRLPSILSTFHMLEQKHPKEAHYYLGVLGVDPDLQGRGLGTQLMRPVLDMCDRDHVPAYLESSKEKNVPLYERNGFKVTEVLQLPKDGPTLWLMFREPQ